MALSFTQDLDTLYTTTWALRRTEAVNQIFNVTPLWYILTKKGKKTTQEGGTKIEVPLGYAKNETVKFFGRGSTIDINDTQPLTMARYDWKYLAASIMRYFVDDQKNRGKAKVISIIDTKLNNAEASMVDQLEESAFGDGTGDSGLAIEGLGNIVATDPTTGTVAGINRASYSWWQNQYRTMTGKSASVYLRGYMNNMFNRCGKKGKGVGRFPDFLITSQTVYEYYDAECFEIGRIMIGDKKLADLGFGDLAFKGRSITWSPALSDNNMYFCNSNHLQWVADPIANFDLTDWKSIPGQPNDRVAQLVTVGNLVADRCDGLGVLFLIDTE